MSETEGVQIRLAAARQGDRGALDALMPIVYGELKRIARAQLAREQAGTSLQATALVHEAYVRLLDAHSVDWRDRQYFFWLAATMMRRILVNHARDKAAEKRGGAEQRLSLDEARDVPIAGGDIDLAALDEALTQLERIHARQAKVVELKYFGGMDYDEIGSLLDISNATARRDFQLAKAWLAEALGR